MTMQRDDFRVKTSGLGVEKASHTPRSFSLTSGVATSFLSALAIAALLLAGVCAPAHACTLFAAAGTAVEGGGTLIAKNRDWLPDHRQQLIVLAPEGGHRAVALEAVGGTESGVKAGVNERGLAIVSATAGQVSSAERSRIPQTRQLMRRLLTSCADVGEVLARIDLFRRPAFYLVADRREIAMIEVAPDGRRAVSRRQNDVLAHTNHYCALEAPPPGRNPGRSSLTRYARIDTLLRDAQRPFTLEDFVRFSDDRSDGPDNSIWRTGRAQENRRTLAAWIISIPPAGSPRLYVKTADSGEPERTCRLSAEAAFRLRDGERVSLADGLCRPPDPNSFSKQGN
jgi:hypothetical protein